MFTKVCCEGVGVSGWGLVMLNWLLVVCVVFVVGNHWKKQKRYWRQFSRCDCGFPWRTREETANKVHSFFPLPKWSDRQVRDPQAMGCSMSTMTTLMMNQKMIEYFSCVIFFYCKTKQTSIKFQSWLPLTWKSKSVGSCRRSKYRAWYVVYYHALCRRGKNRTGIGCRSETVCTECKLYHGKKTW